MHGAFGRMQKIMGSVDFVGLHVRVEKDWIDHCQNFEGFKVCGPIGYMLII